MADMIVNTLKKKEIPIYSKNIKHHRENPSYLVLKLENAYSCVEVVLAAKYNRYKEERYGILGSFDSKAYYHLCRGKEMREIIIKAMKKARRDAEKFYRKTLEILVKRNYELHLYDNGNIELRVNGKQWEAKKRKWKI